MSTFLIVSCLALILIAGLILLHLLRTQRILFGALMDLLDEQQKLRRRLSRPTMACRQIDGQIQVMNLSANPAVNTTVQNAESAEIHSLGLVMPHEHVPVPDAIDTSKEIVVNYAATGRRTVYATRFDGRKNTFERAKRSKRRRNSH